ncbi:MAG TPA: hypothetical protein PLA73_08620 [Sedimentibacter sp.]|nr:hypothetical protein [Sedimentibacter sp.]
MVTEALYIYAFSLFESTLSESVRHFLSAFPEKMGKMKEKLNFQSMYEHPFYSGYFLTELVDEEVERLNKGDAKKMLCSSLRTFDIKDNEFNKYFADLEIISDKRNKLVHETARITNDYIHSPRYNKEIDKKISNELYSQHLEVMVNVLSHFKIELANKYGKYTKRKLLCDLWNEVFSNSYTKKATPLLPFEKCFSSGETIHLNIEYLETVKDSISSSEQYFLSLFLQNHNGTLQQEWFKRLPGFVSIDDKEKIYQILHLFIIYPLLLQGAEKYDDIVERSKII